MKREGKETMRWKSPKLQDQSHRSTLAALPRYLRVIWRRTSLPTILSVQLTGEQLKWQPCLGRLYIHPHSHTHTQVTHWCQPCSPLLWGSLLFLCCPVYGGGWQRWAHNPLMPKQRELDHPWADLPWSNASPICTLRCREDRLGQTGDPCLALPLRGVCASAAGQHDSLYKALSNAWLTHPRPARATFTPTTANYPKTQTVHHTATSFVIAPVGFLAQTSAYSVDSNHFLILRIQERVKQKGADFY